MRSSARLPLGEALAAAAGGVLLLGMSLDWFTTEITANRIPGATALAERAGGLSAWEAFGSTDVVLFVAAVVAIAQLAARLTGGMPRLPVYPGVVVAVAGAVALIAAIVGIVDPPIEEGRFAGVVVDASREPGAWLSLLACVGIVVGGLMSAGAQRRAREPSPGGGRPAVATVRTLEGRPELEDR